MTDYLQECMADFTAKVDKIDPNQGKITTREFMATFCGKCRNPDCVNAGWAEDRFSGRVRTQYDRFLNPLQLDPMLPKFASIVAADFKDMLHKAYQLEVADRRGDWEIPEIPIMDGKPVLSQSSTGTVDSAIRSLAKAQGRPEPLVQVEEPAPKLVVPPPLPAPHHPKTPVTKVPAKGNTARPAPMMLDGSPLPTTPATKAASPPQTEPDPWTPKPEIRKVNPGATIRMGGEPKK